MREDSLEVTGMQNEVRGSVCGFRIVGDTDGAALLGSSVWCWAGWRYVSSTIVY
jgi:hypothetical protein